MGHRAAGLTLVEVLVALLVLMIVMTAVMNVYLSALFTNSGAATRTRVTQIMSSVTDRVTQHVLTVAEGESTVLVFQPGTPPTQLTLASAPSSCASYLLSEAGRAHHCVTVRNSGSFNPSVGGTALLGTAVRTYLTQACWNERGTVRCVEATTIY
ncbi:type II secretory pathway pseudopilin PulG [Deinococcus sp. HSC-46F16]|uniref:prepilin-type N-terminal cleavage/methylation domain-containing protein n=1 Tax=Deinococcus sp. HSC-46F16 TaxID=2910968 RepID=UPI00209D6A09|nr:prepilin-type N-terminal cleavage/methylation domain-containing protein [Deinococcus sp. HSC-46F16]MCP2014242.1 type II secretory pathway pseudopilin PulG [Deinococcus sp. HSC-46F16]